MGNKHPDKSVQVYNRALTHAMPRLKRVQNLSEEIQQSLEDVYRHDARFVVRQRAHAILLSAKGYTITQLQEIFAVDRDTVSAWITRFERFGMTGLQDLPRSGRPPIYTDDEVLQLQALIEQEPRQLKRAQARLEQATGKTACTVTLRRALKKTALFLAPLPSFPEKPARSPRVRLGSAKPEGLTAHGG
jgi:transposase